VCISPYAIASTMLLHYISENGNSFMKNNCNVGDIGFVMLINCKLCFVAQLL